ncbi:hypothetical protein CEXT_436141 [Caerostris extrusa]|uniref:Uncharacterized protein n=1 Tax=Caerostris extrusa TaxID=172846 RepID=A0AAV4MP33_CAEEX|nr:hypothetical protein CEXT_436141 [Caerostris extrusa]
MTPHKTSPTPFHHEESKPDNCLEIQRFGDPFCESSLRLTPTQSQQKRSRSISGREQPRAVTKYSFLMSASPRVFIPSGLIISCTPGFCLSLSLSLL